MEDSNKNIQRLQHDQEVGPLPAGVSPAGPSLPPPPPAACRVLPFTVACRNADGAPHQARALMEAHQDDDDQEVAEPLVLSGPLWLLLCSFTAGKNASQRPLSGVGGGARTAAAVCVASCASVHVCACVCLFCPGLGFRNALLRHSPPCC